MISDVNKHSISSVSLITFCPDYVHFMEKVTVYKILLGAKKESKKTGKYLK